MFIGGPKITPNKWKIQIVDLNSPSRAQPDCECNPDLSPITAKAERFLRVYSRLVARVTNACAIFRGIVSPCGWSNIVEPATAKKAVETAQVNIKRPFHGRTSGLHDTSVERIFGKMETTVIHPHLVFLTAAARAVLKARRVSLGLDSISEGHLVIRIVVPCHPIFPDARVTSVQLSVSYLKLRMNIPPTDSDVRKNRIAKYCHSVWSRNVWHT